MQTFWIKRGSTSNRIKAFIADASKADGSGLSGLVWNTVGLTWRQIADGDAAEAGVALAAAVLGTFTSGGFVEVHATNMKGLYELGVPNALAASAAAFLDFMLFGAANMVPTPIRIILYDGGSTELLQVHEALCNKQEIDRVARQKKIYKADGVTVSRTFQIATTATGKTETPV